MVHFCIVALGIAHHEIWVDEAQAWLLARDSGSIVELLRNMRYEGHPASWHILLWGLSRFTRDPAAMQLLHLLIATASVYLLGRFAPLPRAHKVLIAFGYFFVYEFAVISRGYALGVLSLFGLLALFPHRRESYLPLAAMLFLMANTSVYGLILSMALGATLLLEWVGDDELRRRLGEKKVAVGLSIVIASAGMAVSIAQMTPPPDAPFTGAALRDEIPWHRAAAHTMATVWNAYAPLPDFQTPHLWSTNLLDGSPGLRPLAALLSIAIVVGAATIFARRRLVLFLFVLGTGGLLAFIFWKVTGTLRHHGHLFVLFVACYWLARLCSPAPWNHAEDTVLRRPWERWFVLAILVVQLGAGATLWIADAYRTFDGGRETASRIEEQGLDGLVWFGDPAPHANVVAAFADRSIYYPSIGGFGTFVPFGRHRWITEDELVNEVKWATRALGPEIVLILNRPFPGIDGVVVEPVAHVPPDLMPHEYRVYRARSGPTAP
jgi:hypothetical protein